MSHNKADDLQDKLRKERVNDFIVNQCKFDIIEKYDESSSDEKNENNHQKEHFKNDAKNIDYTFNLVDESPKFLNKKAEKENNNILKSCNVSFPPALHRSILNLQKNNKNEKLDLNKIYNNNNSFHSCENSKNNEHENKQNYNFANKTIPNIKYNDNHKKDINIEKTDLEKKIHNNNHSDYYKNNDTKKYNVIFKMNKNELAKLQWTNPIEDTEIREIKNMKEIKLHEIRFDFSGRLRIQINENLYNEKERKKIFDNFDGLYHHNEEPLNSGYTLPELLFLCQSSYPNQVCIALKIMKHIFINMYLKVSELNDVLLNSNIINNYQVKNKYSYTFTFNRFVNYLNNDLNIFSKLLFLFNYYNNKNLQFNCLHAMASYLFPNNTYIIKDKIIFDGTEENKINKFKYSINYEFFSYHDLFSDNIFFDESYNIFFYSSKKGQGYSISDLFLENNNSKIVKNSIEHRDNNIYDSNQANNLNNPKDDDITIFINKCKENEIKNEEEKVDKIIVRNTTKKKYEQNDENNIIYDKILCYLKNVNGSADNPSKLLEINLDIIKSYKKTNDNEDIEIIKLINNISNILENNFAVVEVENSCVCLLTGLLIKYKHEINILKNKDLVKNLEKICESKIVGSYLYNERIKKECLNTNQRINCSDLNFVYNLITLIRYIIIYNYDKDFFQIFDVLSFLIFYRTLPFSLNIENCTDIGNNQNVEKINDNMEKNTNTAMRHFYLFISTETLKVFRILLSCNLYKESVEYFHDIVNKIHKINIKNDIICKKFLTQVYLYISTYNLKCVDMDLSGLLYTSKIIKTLEIQINNVDNHSIHKEEKCYEYIHADNSFSYSNNMKQQNKLDFNYLNDLILINQCFNYIYTLFICIRKKCINIEQCIHTEQIYKLMKLVQRIGYVLIRNLSWLLDWYKDDAKRNNDKNEDSIIKNIFNKRKECPFIFSYIIYEQYLDPHFFFVIFIQILNGILKIIFEINYMNEVQNNDDKISANNICDKIKSLIDLFSHLNRDVLKLFKIDVFKIENILDSNNVFLPLSYLFYNLYKLFNINVYKEQNVSSMNTNQNKLKNNKICDTILRNDNMNLIFYSLVFCSSVSLSYFSLKEITKQPNISINKNIKGDTYTYSDQFLLQNNSEMLIKREMKNDDGIKESTLLRYTKGDIPTSFQNADMYQREICSNYENNDEYIKDINVAYVILFLQKYIKESLSIYNSKKNIFLLLLKNMFRECNKPLNYINKKEEIIISKVLILFLNKNVLNFLVKHMDVSTFFKFFIQIFLVNNHKQIGDYMNEHINIYNYFVSIAELYIFNNIYCDADTLRGETTFFDEKLEYKKSIENIVFSFLQNEIERKKGMEQNGDNAKSSFRQNEDILNNFEKNKQNIKSCIRLKRLNISSVLSQTVFEKIIESFKLGYFFNPLLLSILFFFSTVSFPQECRNIFFNDYDILKILGKNIFIHFFDNQHYIIYTISTYYGLKQHNYIVDLTKFFPSIFSFIYNSYDNFILHQNLEEYFKNLLTEYSDPSFLHFLFFVKKQINNKQKDHY
ncbi:RNA polymerase II-associated protein 1, putative [Plasmodium berghei]|uniref:RNA polymerase II-associated protein 1, putative n=2 Tax=Plasmodium berghei TaxID=5821 RepID=A0A509AF18_PLABA|nr:RNA polymerase II-associated protein 1, putative [Plasmodium berghei ANKA]CXI11333.1 RNA polymerase II-associated protein 1, putative [Plasmodium berghei]SCL93180.1 RNA polymerase II-associated protein 1, putative [Plasmodium berghei]SCM15804.1 RNA polymerase II-associated protein 1, putative [Plasmodium berghei]SCM17599.1 RNA polymerase II-associated protein 1, putative [Plasmodium berghei]SCN23080.1 RNA polymerase II-associated protein 1, putative [Plasmodium berghei]|eukprot:XP_034420408.1 RNA polymerase II-associated protein 1, putative [Plasmodium berghei ANKA]